MAAETVQDIKHIVYARTKNTCMELWEELTRRCPANIKKAVRVFHADISRQAKKEVMEAFRDGSRRSRKLAGNLEGPDIPQYVEKQQAVEMDERVRERDAQREHELELEALKLKQAEIEYKTGQKKAAEEVKAKTPRLPSLTEGEGIDGYLLRFKRFARANHWAEGTWASLLSALLTGMALDVYSRLSDDDTQYYNKVKDAILKRYELTEDGFRKKFRSKVPQEGEGPDQYLIRLSSYLNRWVELSDTPRTYEGICDMIVQEQFLDLVPVELSTHLS
ncbi:LOW QUALITY PROTEIN: uncharacterized protein LOC144914156 [Branchiostoma floridae x Branchiostoma belcheri]